MSHVPPHLDRHDPEYVRQLILDVISEVVPKVISEGVPMAVNSALERLGFDSSNPIQMQKQAQYLREATELWGDPEVWADRAHLRAWRKQCEMVKSVATSVVVKSAVAGVIGIVILGGLAWLRQQGL